MRIGGYICRKKSPRELFWTAIRSSDNPNLELFFFFSISESVTELNNKLQFN